jgi:hypothetical protein
VDLGDMLQCVQKGLDVFGVNVKDATYFALEANDNLTPWEILEFPEAFIRALKEVFGPGYVIAERSVIKEMQKMFEMTLPASSYSMSEAFNIARRQIEDENRGSGVPSI